MQCSILFHTTCMVDSVNVLMNKAIDFIVCLLLTIQGNTRRAFQYCHLLYNKWWMDGSQVGRGSSYDGSVNKTCFSKNASAIIFSLKTSMILSHVTVILSMLKKIWWFQLISYVQSWYKYCDYLLSKHYSQGNCGIICLLRFAKERGEFAPKKWSPPTLPRWVAEKKRCAK